MYDKSCAGCAVERCALVYQLLCEGCEDSRLHWSKLLVVNWYVFSTCERCRTRCMLHCNRSRCTSFYYYSPSSPLYKLSTLSISIPIAYKQTDPDTNVTVNAALLKAVPDNPLVGWRHKRYQRVRAPQSKLFAEEVYQADRKMVFPLVSLSSVVVHHQC